jgi:mannose/fructose/N-acetylgalactosamine-specific phosphotransferase system component IID
MVIGAMIPSLVKLNLAGIINIGGAEVVLQEIVDGVMPCLLPLLLVFACYKALQKKVSGTVIMIALMVFGVIGSMIGLL